jgi:hypothetical protein
MRRSFTGIIVLALFVVGTTTPVVAAGEPRAQCTIDGTTSLSGPVPKSTTDARFDWYGPVGYLGGQVWTSGAKRFPTPAGAATALVYLHGPEIELTAICEP